MAVALSFVGDHPEEAHALRKYGNLIHPYRARNDSWAPPGEGLAQSALNYVSLFVQSIRRRLETSGPQADQVSQPHKTASELNFSWVVEGEIAGCRGPHSDSDLSTLVALGIRALVRLADTEEATVTTQRVRGAGLEDCHEPVPDWTAPKQEQIHRVLSFVADALDSGDPVAVSCGAGYGRTGTILACYLVSEGRGADDAIQHLISVRPVSEEILRIAGQKEAVFEFERRFKSGEVTL